MERLRNYRSYAVLTLECAYSSVGPLSAPTMVNGKLSALRWVMGSEWDGAAGPAGPYPFDRFETDIRACCQETRLTTNGPSRGGARHIVERVHHVAGGRPRPHKRYWRVLSYTVNCTGLTENF
jgi:hypothetical protein